MRILIISNSFHEIKAVKIADIIAKAWQKTNPNDRFIILPLSDNGDFRTDTIKFDIALEQADIVLIGNENLSALEVNEGVFYKVAKRAKSVNKPVIAFAIQVSSDVIDLFDAAFSIVNQPMSVMQARMQVANLLENSVYQVASLYKNIRQTSIGIIAQPKAEIVQKWIFLNASLVLDKGQIFRLILEKTIKAGGMIVLYGSHTKQTYKTFFKAIELSCPFIVEYGAGIYIPKSATTLYFDNMEQNDQYFYQQLGISAFMIQNIVDKLAKISGVKLELIKEKQATHFSAAYQLKNAATNLTLFQNLIQQQGLDCIQKGERLWIGQRKLSTTIEALLNLLSTKQTNLTTYGIGIIELDRPILEQVNEPYLIKQEDGWLPLQLPMLNMINQEGIEGVKLVFEEILREG